MRVKTKDNKIIGEIEKIYKDELIVSYNDGSNMGWNLENSYNQITLNKDDVIKLDEGLNSPWKILLNI
uniref:PRC-barrel domain-containing protein n=1 Tax=Florenciella sp. virus SA2 TaxID=3240092 RepID=A0AB39JFX0_9VIRU